MLNILKLLAVNLKLFDGEAAGASSGSAPAAAGQADNTNIPGSNRQGKGEKVIYGKQGSEAGTQGSSGSENKPAENKGQAANDQNTQVTLEERRTQFEKMISSDYKDLFGERVQNIIDKRFRDTKILENRFGSLQPALDILMSRYNVKSEKDLADAVLKDDAYLSDAADEAGMSVEQYRRFLQTEAENRRLRAFMQDNEARRQAQIQYSKWDNEVANLKGTPDAPGLYPNLDLNVEASNPQFQSMLDSLTRAGFPNPVQTAYETLHMDEIKTGIARTTAQKVTTNVTENIRAKGTRPQENGINNQSGVIVKNDVHQLSRQDRKEIAKRAARGENISF